MSISAIGGTSGAATPPSTAQGDRSAQIQKQLDSLNTQLKALQQQDYMEPAQKEQRVEVLEERIEALEEQLALLQPPNDGEEAGASYA